jgi:hypothetical protein
MAGQRGTERDGGRAGGVGEGVPGAVGGAGDERDVARDEALLARRRAQPRLPADDRMDGQRRRVAERQAPRRVEGRMGEGRAARTGAGEQV